VDEAEEQALFEFADLVLALGRQIQGAKQNVEIHGGTSWTLLDSAVMRFIDRNPGTTAGAAAEATQLISSNFSRALRGLERKGLVRRERDPKDARRVHLYPTELAHENLRRLRSLWSELLEGIVADRADIERVNLLLRHVESALNARKMTAVSAHAGRGGDKKDTQRGHDS
jgi:MarR family transcriptional regulator, temperature-dependent positive regulator of motility